AAIDHRRWPPVAHGAATSWPPPCPICQGVTEQEFRAELKPYLEWSCLLSAEFWVAAIEPGRLPTVGLVGQVKLRAPASIAALTGPRERLIQSPIPQLHGPR